MPRRNNRSSNNEVRGPNSALTAFLQEQGINANTIRERHLQRLRGEEVAEIEEEENGGNSSGVLQGLVADLEERQASREELEEEKDEDVETQEIRIASRRKRRAARRRNLGDDEDNDDLGEYTDSDDADGEYGNTPSTVKRPFQGELTNCVECKAKFKVNVYSKKFIKNGKTGYLCNDCAEEEIRKEKSKRKNEINARKKRKKMAAALLDRQDFKIPTLQDICIKLISKNIDDVEAFGDIGLINMNKIGKILSKNRSLNDKTMTLFLMSNLKELEFWDCSNIDSSSLNKIAAYCPNIEKLSLEMCGQLHNDNLEYFATNLKKLKHISLNGPFLISDSTWQSFFEKIGHNLQSFEIANTHRFLNDSLISLLENCGGENFTHLKLSRLDGLDSKVIYELLPHYLTNLQHLEISYPHKEELIDDAMLINLLSVNGESLEDLILDGCSNLTDNFLITGIKPFCSKLRKLSLGLLDQVTDNGMVQLFTDWDINDGLMYISFRRCISLTDESIAAMLKHSCLTLIELNLNSVNKITSNFWNSGFFQKNYLKLLTVLDLGFVRSCDDKVIEILNKCCPNLKILEVYGNNRCTSNAKIRNGLTVIGRQSDSI